MGDSHEVLFCRVRCKWQLLDEVSGGAFKKDKVIRTSFCSFSLLLVWTAAMVLGSAAAFLRP